MRGRRGHKASVTFIASAGYIFNRQENTRTGETDVETSTLTTQVSVILCDGALSMSPFPLPRLWIQTRGSVLLKNYNVSKGRRS